MTHVLVLSLYGPLAASTRYRFMQFIPELGNRGVKLDVQPLLDDHYIRARFNNRSAPIFNILGSILKRLKILKKQKKYDCLIVHCELFPFLPAWIERILLKIPYIYDFDDAFYLKYKTNYFSFRSIFLGSKFDAIISGANEVTAGSHALEKYAKLFNKNVSLLPTVVDANIFFPKEKPDNNAFHIGWIGSPSTAPYLSELIKPLTQLGREIKVIFTIIGGKAPRISNVEIREVAWSELTEVDFINSFDIGVMPLPNNMWTQGKCAFKLIQYMSCSLPIVASPVGENLVVADKSCGLFANDEKDWLNAFRYMNNHPKERARMGANGRNRIIEKYSLSNNISIIERAITKACK
jgi:glycosyltransferase involved in cell wall biosynthesis